MPGVLSCADVVDNCKSLVIKPVIRQNSDSEKNVFTVYVLKYSNYRLTLLGKNRYESNNFNRMKINFF